MKIEKDGTYMLLGETVTVRELDDFECVVEDGAGRVVRVDCRELTPHWIPEHKPRDPEQPDLRGPAVIVTGSVIGGFKFVGPFATIEEASQWHSTKSLEGICGVGVTIVLLEDPVSAQVR